MPIRNADIAAILEEIADLLEIDGANVFRIRAYHNAPYSQRAWSGCAHDGGRARI